MTASRRGVGRLTSRQVNLLLEVAVAGALISGVTSWAVGTGWNRWWTAVHAIYGFALLVLAPAKARSSVRTGMKRGRPTRWLSAAFGVMITAIVALGFAHSTGIWHGEGYWSALWTHFLLAFAAVPLFVWHVVSRPVRPKRIDLDRRLLLGGGAALGVAAAAVGSVEVVTRLLDLPGGRRRFTGSHEVGSFRPDEMPAVSWIDDRAPATQVEEWELTIAGTPRTVAELRAMSTPVDATLDCTGGWWSRQRWDAVPVSALLADVSARSFVVRSATGYTRAFPMADAPHVHLAVGYDGRPLRRSHGAPVRVIAPGRRGPWWVKWAVSIEPSDRPWWLQLPFPAT